MTNYTKAFVGNSLPDFINANHPQFKLFIESYYEWLEQQNTGTSTSVLNLFQELQNPVGLINNATTNRDIDETLDGFVDYFRRELIPIAVDTAAATDRFTIKKIRDLYLAKGTPKSYRLLFRLIYSQEIDIFLPYENVLKTSEGSFLSFPVSHYEVTQYSEKLDEIDLQLSYITAGETDSDIIVTNLTGVVVGKENDRPIIKVQLANEVELDLDREYYLFDLDDNTKWVKIKPLTTIKSIQIKNGGSFYKENDKVDFYSTHFDQSNPAVVRATERSPVSHVIVRNRGYNYAIGDAFYFTTDNVYDGQGGYVTVTDVDKNGRILELDGTRVRTGSLHNGFQSSTFEDVKIPVLEGGAWKVLPSVTYYPNGERTIAAPYNDQQVGKSVDIFPVAEALGTVNSVQFKEVPYFFDSDDITVQETKNLVVSSIDGLEKGQIVAFSVFEPKDDSFLDDSEQILYQIQNFRSVESNWEKYHVHNFIAPFGYDSELFQWNLKRLETDSDKGLSVLSHVWDSDSSLYLTLKHDSDIVFDGRLWDDIVTGTRIDGGTNFGSGARRIDLGAYENIPGDTLTVNYNGNKIVDQLDSFHFRGLEFAYNYDDSEMIFSWSRIKSDPRLGNDSDVGSWTDTQMYGKILSIDNNIVKIIPEPGYNFPTDSELYNIKLEKYSVLRIQPIDENGAIEPNVALPLTNVLVDYSSFAIDWTLGSYANTLKTFINEDSFLSSPAGSVLQDNYQYSPHTYNLKTTLSMDSWREKVKTLLHPAGKLLFGNYVIEQQTHIKTPVANEINFEIRSNVTFDFSQANDHLGFDDNKTSITADTGLYKANSFEDGFKGINVDNFSNIVHYDDITQQGNAYWDYEPIGYVHEEQIPFTGFGTYENFDPTIHYNKVTTQDSDGTGFVSSYLNRWAKYDASKQDLYKNDSRDSQDANHPVISRVYFSDVVTQRFEIYDSELPRHVFMRFQDSDVPMKGIDYKKLRTPNDTRNMPPFSVPRQFEFNVQRNKDFREAMRDTGSFTFTVGETIHKDFEAYETKWNTYHDNRTTSPEGWEINGYHSFIQNRSNNKPRIVRTSDYGFEQVQYSKLKTPLNEALWNQSGADWWTWNPTYGKEINTQTTFDYDLIKQDEHYTNFDYDPEKWMKGRKAR